MSAISHTSALAPGCPQSNPRHYAPLPDLCDGGWCRSIFSCTFTSRETEMASTINQIWSYTFGLYNTGVKKEKKRKATKYKSYFGPTTTSCPESLWYYCLFFLLWSWVGRAYARAIYIWTISAEWISPDSSAEGMQRKRWGRKVGETCSASSIVYVELYSTLVEWM